MSRRPGEPLPGPFSTPIRLTVALACGLLAFAALPIAYTVRAGTPAPGPQPVTGAAPVNVTAGQAGYNAFPEGLLLPDGTIRVYYAHGSYHGGPATGVVRSSTDGGKTWSAPKDVGTIKSPIRLTDGTILAASTLSIGTGGTDSRRPASTRSMDGGLTWTTDGLAAGGAGFGANAMPYGLVRLGDGSLLMSVSGKATPTDPTWFVRYLRSTDEGKTWSIRSTIQAAGISYAEPSLAVAPDGTVVTAMRVDDADGIDGTIHMTESHDGGATWAPLRAVFPHASGYPSIAFLRDGSLVVMYRSTSLDWMPFRYARSIDDGATWSYGLDFTGGSLKKMMAGTWLIDPGSSRIGVLYGLESDWYHAAVYYRALDIPSSGTEVRSMTREYDYTGAGTLVRFTGRAVRVTSTGGEQLLPGASVHFSLRSYDPKDGTILGTAQLDTKAGSDGIIRATVPVPRHGELEMTVTGTSSVTYRLGTFRAQPGFSACPETQAGLLGQTYWLWCQAGQAPLFGGEFQRWDGSTWVHQKSAWADADGFFRTPVTATATPVKYRLTIWQTKWTDRVWSRTITVSTKDPVPTVRYAGPDRFATAAAVSANTFDPGVDIAYIANAYNFPDALAGAAAAGMTGKHGPVLLVAATGAINASTATELTRLHPQKIVVLGSAGVVSDAVLNALKAYATGGNVVRYAGPNRFATAAAVSANTFDPGVDIAYIANAYNFPDALAGAAAAGMTGKHGPVLLVAATGAINASTATELTRLHPQKIVVLGSSGVVSDAVLNALKAYATGGNVVRYAGPNRFATAAAISAHTFSPGVGVVYIANAYNFPDALAGAAAAGMKQGPVLLVAPTGAINASTAAELTRLHPQKIVVLGSTGVVSDAVKSALAGL